MNTVSKYFIIFSFFFICSCGGKKPAKPHTEVNTPPPPSQTPSPTGPVTPHNPNDCKATTMSVKGADCFHPLPAKRNNQKFTSSYKETLNIHTKGVTVGKGSWICYKGQWKQYYNTCLTCLPGHSLEHCQNELNNLIQLNP